MPHTPIFAPLLLSLAFPTACNRPPEPQPGGSANYSASLGDDPDFSKAYGRIEVETWFDYGETQLSGHVADGPMPYHHGEAERIGSCRLMTYAPSSCDPTCDGHALCVDGECQDYPEFQDKGDMLWTWPDGEQTVSPNDWFAYWATGTASTTGAVTIATDDLDLTAPTIDPPEEDGDWAREISNRSDGDATLRWSNPIIDARIRLHMTDCTGTHGGIAEAEVECEGPDTGELVIAGAFLDAMDAGDWSHGECGNHDFQRYHAAAPEGDDTVRLETIGDGGLFYRPDW